VVEGFPPPRSRIRMSRAPLVRAGCAVPPLPPTLEEDLHDLPWLAVFPDDPTLLRS